MRKMKNYFELYYSWVNKNFNINNYSKIVMRNIGSYLDKKHNILDIGCGCGYLLKVLENSGFKNLTGVEIDKGQFLNCKKILKNSKLYNMDIINFFKKINKKFNVIIAFDLIEHLPKNKILYFIELVYKHLENDGLFIIRIPNADCFFTASRMRYGDFTHETIFNSESIKSFLIQANFKLNNIKTYPWKGNIINDLIKNFFDFFIKIYLILYVGRDALRLIFTPNFLVIAKK